MRLALALALLVTVGAAFFPTDEAGIVAPVERDGVSGGAIAVAAAAAPAPLAAEGRPASADADKTSADAGPMGMVLPDPASMRRVPSVIRGGDPFFVAPPPPPPPAPKPRKTATPAPPPQAPPLPFRMIGSVDEDGRVTVFAERANGDVVAMRVADIVDNVYRVDRIGEKSMILTYLPLGHQQTLPLGEANR